MGDVYGGFAEIYDQCMRFVPYDRWVEYVEKILSRHRASVKSLVDLGCGTGSTTLPWARKGLKTLGIDRSGAMLDRARVRAREEGLDVEFIQQDIRDFSLEAPVDVALCLYDTINYILDPTDIGRVFSAVHQNLVPGGMFIFDINSCHKLSGTSRATFHLEGEDYHLIWQQHYSEVEKLWVVHLTGFVECEDGRYRRFQEEHRERAYTRKEIQDLLEATGFTLLGCYRAYSFETASSTDDRFFFVASREEYIA